MFRLRLGGLERLEALDELQGTKAVTKFESASSN